MDNNKLEKICELYELELKLLDEYADDINNEEKYNVLQSCHDKRCNLMSSMSLAEVYEKVKGLNNPLTIELYMEEAEQQNNDYEQMVLLYTHALEGCRSLYGEIGEKTIECKLQIAILIRNICEQNEEKELVNNKYTYKMVLQILEELFLHKHDHPLYGSFIATMLCDEYIREGNKTSALETFQKWSQMHSIENIYDIEEVNAWIEYTSLLAELGWLKTAVNNVERIEIWMKEHLSEFDEMLPYLYRRLTEIYVSCTLYEKALKILENLLKYEETYSEQCREEFYNIKAQLAHCYYLSGNRVKAAMTALELQKVLLEVGIEHPSKYQFDNILSNILGALGDSSEQYEKMYHAYTESRRRYGENHEETILYEMNLGKACFQLYYKSDEKDKYINDAEFYMEDAYEHSEYGRGKGNLFSLLIKSNLAEVKAEKGDIITAIQMLEQVWHRFSEIFSEDNPETADAKIRYASLCLEAQENWEEVPEWIENVDVELLLEEGFLTKEKFLGIKHWETIDALHWYVRAVQSNELITYMRHEEIVYPFEKSLKLHKLLLLNIGDMLQQAFYINSIQKQNEYMTILEHEFFHIFWILVNCKQLDIEIDVKEIYDMIAVYKNISYDMQKQKFSKADDGMRKKFADFLSSDTALIKYLYTETNYVVETEVADYSLVKRIVDYFHGTKKVFVDIWQEANEWNVFIIDGTGIKYREISYLSDEEIPFIEEENSLCQSQLDDMEYSLEESFYWSKFIVGHLTEELTGYDKVFWNLHKQLHQFPIVAFFSDQTGIISEVVSSIYQVLDSNTERKIAINNIGFWEKHVSWDQQIVKAIFHNTNRIHNISNICNIICISGHGYYLDDMNIPEGKRNYVEIEDNHRIYIQDIISKNMRHVDLVFLPICQSGNGKDYQNFGNYSIGKAFRIAGAEYAIETLWDVPLSASLIFEYEFFGYLKETENISKAFYNAVLRLKNYTIDDLKKFCKFLLNLSVDKKIIKILYSEISNGCYPFKDMAYWAGFCLQKGES